MGLPYHQASIRPLELDSPASRGQEATTLYSGEDADKWRFSEGSRKFMRGYVYVDWGDIFKHRHDEAFPYLAAGIAVGLGSIARSYTLRSGGSAYSPLRMTNTMVRSGQLSRDRGSPVFQRTGSVVCSSVPTDPELLQLGLRALRESRHKSKIAFEI
ncbi:hypothetical protein [Dongia sp.]|uniref:hypothetical protein n=1 Tax=Dongia sp. TaxID=1977262 RepID=UPI0037519397